MNTILVLEDSTDDAFLIGRALRYACGDCATAFVDSGEQAIQYLQRKPPYTNCDRPSLILVDLEMPGLGGLEFLRWLRAHREYNSVPALILTNNIAVDAGTEAARLGAQGYFVKPATQDALYSLVKQIERDWLAPS